MINFFSDFNLSRSNPRDLTLMERPGAVSSKDMKTQGSLYCTMPLIRNCIERSVFPQPAPPQINVGLPFGKPPSVISSKPSTPVGVFGNVKSFLSEVFLFEFTVTIFYFTYKKYHLDVKIT